VIRDEKKMARGISGKKDRWKSYEKRADVAMTGLSLRDENSQIRGEEAVMVCRLQLQLLKNELMGRVGI